MSDILLEDNHFDAVDIGWCKKLCAHNAEPINRQGYCESCYYNQTCCVPGCDNVTHIEGEDGCSLHELEAARDEGDAAQVALWEAYYALDATITKPRAAFDAAKPDINAPIFSHAWTKAVLNWGKA